MSAGPCITTACASLCQARPSGAAMQIAAVGRSYYLYSQLDSDVASDASRYSRRVIVALGVPFPGRQARQSAAFLNAQHRSGIKIPRGDRSEHRAGRNGGTARQIRDTARVLMVTPTL